MRGCMVLIIAHPVEKAISRTHYLIDIQGFFAYTPLPKDNVIIDRTGCRASGWRLYEISV
jgi:hypothetical protein